MRGTSKTLLEAIMIGLEESGKKPNVDAIAGRVSELLAHKFGALYFTVDKQTILVLESLFFEITKGVDGIKKTG